MIPVDGFIITIYTSQQYYLVLQQFPGLPRGAFWPILAPNALPGGVIPINTAGEFDPLIKTDHMNS
jgi:hypothetical protein